LRAAVINVVDGPVELVESRRSVGKVVLVP